MIEIIGLVLIIGAFISLALFIADNFVFLLICLTFFAGIIALFAGNLLFAVCSFGLFAYLENYWEKYPFGKPKKTAPDDNTYYWDLEEEIMTQCYDEQTTIFNWDKWFNRRDEIIYSSAPPVIIESIDSDFYHYGQRQIYSITAIIENKILSTNPFNPEAGVKELKRTILDTGILINLPCMFASKEGQYDASICPQKVTDYQKMLLDILHNRTIADKPYFDTLVKLGREIAY